MNNFLSHNLRSHLVSVCTTLLGLLLISGCAHKPAAIIPAPQAVAEVANRAADWQLAHMENFDYVRTFRDHTENSHGWIQGAFFVGLNRWAEQSQNAGYLQALVAKGKANKWKIGDKSWHADDQVIGFTYAAVAARTNNLALIAPTQKIMKDILANRATHGLEYQPDPTGQGEATCQRRWCWCDALFMAPPVWAAVGKLTGDPAYLNYVDEEYQATIDYLFDKDEHLFYRDGRFFERRSKNDKKIFWSRGNGWVFAGLPLLIEQIPANDPRKQKYESLFKTMAASLLKLQQPNGFWPSSLLDKDEFNVPETSGTGFMTFGLAWGINNGLLSKAEYLPAVNAGWNGLASAVDKTGKLGWVQQVGASPEKILPEDTQLYGVGALLLAASEVSRL
jgi:unsaturated rhamnogalacturonyl hydrolase